jgi:hypothetical protein
MPIVHSRGLEVFLLSFHSQVQLEAAIDGVSALNPLAVRSSLSVMVVLVESCNLPQLAVTTMV